MTSPHYRFLKVLDFESGSRFYTQLNDMINGCFWFGGINLVIRIIAFVSIAPNSLAKSTIYSYVNR